MSMWRCPHCGTPQAESARCWVCRRSSTACATCRHFRRSVAAQLGYCGLDRQRLPLRGDEIRSCWEGRAGVAPDEATLATRPAAGPAGRSEDVSDRTTVRRLEFVPVPEVPAVPPRRPRRPPSVEPAADPDAPVVPPVPAAEQRWNLWGDLEP